MKIEIEKEDFVRLATYASCVLNGASVEELVKATLTAMMGDDE